MDKTHKTDRRTRYTRQAIKEIPLEELKTRALQQNYCDRNMQKGRNEPGNLLPSLLRYR